VSGESELDDDALAKDARQTNEADPIPSDDSDVMPELSEFLGVPRSISTGLEPMVSTFMWHVRRCITHGDIEALPATRIATRSRGLWRDLAMPH